MDRDAENIGTGAAHALQLTSSMRNITCYLTTAIACALAAETAACRGIARRSQATEERSPAIETVAARQDAEPAHPSVAPPKGMQEHFSRGAQAKTAIVRGDLESARRAMEWMAESEWPANLRPEWRSYVQAIQVAARAGAEAADQEKAARALGRIGEACASCHAVAGGPKFSVGPLPLQQLGAEFQPIRHEWAVDRLWEGLIGPSDETWRQGATVLADTPLEPNARVATREMPPELTVLSSKVHEYGRRAQTVGVDRRGETFADVIATCARCHHVLNVKLPAL